MTCLLSDCHLAADQEIKLNTCFRYLEKKKKEKCHTLFVFCVFLFTFAEESNETRSSVQHTAAAAVQVKEEVTIYHHSGILGARFGDSLS